MATPAQINANRINAQNSTGPRSLEGKQTAAANSTSHGLSSTFRVLPHENQHDFQAVLDQFRDEFTPEGEHQLFLVGQMAQSRWRLARVQRLETCLLEQMMSGDDPALDPDARIVAGMMASGGSALAALQRYMAAAERSYYKAHKELREARRDRRAEKSVLTLDSHLARMIHVPTPSHLDYPKPPASAAPRQPETGPRFDVTPGENLALRL